MNITPPGTSVHRYTKIAAVVLPCALTFAWMVCFPIYRTGAVLLAVITVALAIAAWRWPTHLRSVAAHALKWRYAVGAFTVCLLTALRISGSSIGASSFYLADLNAPDPTTLFGEARPIRSDEWGVQAPYFLSQVENHFSLMNPYLQQNGGQNMLVSYNAPVWDITAIGKPTTWGYLFFGGEYGLAFAWSFKLIFLFLLSFDVCRLLTRGGRIVSLAGAALITFSPAVQWWFFPHFVDVIFWSFALLVTAYHFMRSQKLLEQAAFSLLLCCSLVGFTVAFYPGLQVPLGLMALLLLIVMLRRDGVAWSPRLWITGTVSVVAAAAVLVHFWLTCRDAITLITGTEYPGHRVFTGGGSSFSDLFMNLSALVLPYGNLGFGDINQQTSFFHLSPVTFLIAPLIWRQNPRNSLVGKTLFAMAGLTAIWMFVSLPSSLAQDTLLSLVSRAPYVFGLISALLTIWVADSLIRRPGLPRPTRIIATAGYLICFLVFVVQRALVPDAPAAAVALATVESLAFAALLWCTLSGSRRLIVSGFCCMAIIGGLTVNPVIVGNSALTNKTAVEAAATLSQREAGALFLVDSEPFAISNLLAARGVRTLSATTFYPDMDEWQTIDQQETMASCYNRYDNMTAVVTSEALPSCTNPAADSVTVTLTLSNLTDLGVDYVMSRRDLGSLFPSSFEKVFDSPNDPDVYRFTH